MALVVWLCLAFFLVATTGSLAFAGLRALGTWRAFRRFSGATTDALGELTTNAEGVATHAAGLTEGAARVAAAQAHLTGSLAQLSALREALGEATALLAAARGSVPRK